MRAIPDDERLILHTTEIPGSLTYYSYGCRCDSCRAVNAKAGRDRRRRIAMGIEADYELVPNDAARAVVLRMRQRGMVWDGMSEIVGTDRRDLQRLLNQSGGRMTRIMERRVLNAERRLEDNPSLAAAGKKLFHQGARVRWMISCLIARGWTSEWIGEQVGWHHRLSTSTIPYDTVTIELWARVEGVFKAHHESWGPSRMAAVRAWRHGYFFSDCYDWDVDEPDYRVIPGTLHPDLVAEACVYQQKWKSRSRPMMTKMHREYGQWERQSCATAALLAWQDYLGIEHDIEGVEVCGVQSHKHDRLPTVWVPTE